MIFEALMVLCFSAAWPFSIWKSYTSYSNQGKSLGYLVVALAGYMFAMLYKITSNHDFVTYLYAINTIMIVVDLALYYRNYIKPVKNNEDFVV